MILGPFLNISSYISFLFDRYHRCIEKHRNLDMVSSIVCKLVLNILPIQGYCLSSMQNNQSDSFHHSFLAYNAPESIDNNFQGDYRLFLFRFHRLHFYLWTRLRLNVKEIKYTCQGFPGAFKNRTFHNTGSFRRIANYLHLVVVAVLAMDNILVPILFDFQ